MDYSISNVEFSPQTFKIINNVDNLVKDCEKKIKKPKFLYVGQIMWYMLVYNKIICAGKNDKDLRNRIRKMISEQWVNLFLYNKIGNMGRMKALMLWLTPGLYDRMYVKLIGKKDMKRGVRESIKEAQK